MNILISSPESADSLLPLDGLDSKPSPSANQTRAAEPSLKSNGDCQSNHDVRKLRRAPDDSFDLVDGLHRSLLGALGNAIVPQEAYEILQAVRLQIK